MYEYALVRYINFTISPFLPLRSTITRLLSMHRLSAMIFPFHLFPRSSLTNVLAPSQKKPPTLQLYSLYISNPSRGSISYAASRLTSLLLINQNKTPPPPFFYFASLLHTAFPTRYHTHTHSHSHSQSPPKNPTPTDTMRHRSERRHASAKDQDGLSDQQ